MEYIHRMWGRLIFLIFLIPLIIFVKKKYIPEKFKKHLFIILFLILLQGLFGWYMVKSGLVDQYLMLVIIDYQYIFSWLLLFMVIYSFLHFLSMI